MRIKTACEVSPAESIGGNSLTIANEKLYAPEKEDNKAVVCVSIADAHAFVRVEDLRAALDKLEGS